MRCGLLRGRHHDPEDGEKERQEEVVAIEMGAERMSSGSGSGSDQSHGRGEGGGLEGRRGDRVCDLWPARPSATSATGIATASTR